MKDISKQRMDDLNETVKRTLDELAAIERKAGGYVNLNINTQAQGLNMELGRLSEAIIKANNCKDNEEKFSVYFVGVKNHAAKLAARALIMYDYFERNFEPDGKPKEISK